MIEVPSLKAKSNIAFPIVLTYADRLGLLLFSLRNAAGEVRAIDNHNLSMALGEVYALLLAFERAQYQPVRPDYRCTGLPF